MTLALNSVRSLFPIFRHRPDLVYLDSAATSQKPDSVIQTMTTFYETENANIHRGLYELSAAATARYEQVRQQVAAFVGAASADSIAFTKSTTESINLVAHYFVNKKLNKGDNIVISAMEHHANLIPWQQICEQRQAFLRVIPVNDRGELELEHLTKLLDDRTRLLAFTHISNVLGTVNPVDQIVGIAHRKGVPVAVDAAQSAGLYPIQVASWDVDFLSFSAHKMFGPLGVGVLYCKPQFAKEMEPLQYGGGSIRSVRFEHTEFRDYPFLLEAGTPNVAGVLGLGTAIDFIGQLNLSEVKQYIHTLTKHFKEGLMASGGIKIAGNPMNASGIVSFLVEGIHPHDVAGYLANEQIAVRAGHHCAQPLLESMGFSGTVRASFSIYNTEEDVHRTLRALDGVKKFWL